MKIKIHIPAYFPIINNSVDFQFGEEEPFIILQGSNGCGKSTLLHILAGTKKTSDFPRIIVDDEKPFNTIDFKDTIRYLPQDAEDALFTRLSVKDNIKLLKNLLEINEEFEKFEEEVKNELDIDDTNLALWHLSVGQKKVLLLIAILKSLPTIEEFNGKPLIILLDEPFAGLDHKKKKKVFNKIKEISIKYLKCPLKFVIIDHLNIEAITEKKTTEITLRKGIILNEILTQDIKLINGAF